jgi:thioesterase domain-containing protein/acyl carrier protein
VLLPERLPTPGRIGALIRQQQVTTAWLTASLFNALLDEAPQSLRGLEQLLTGGEALSVGHIRRALQQLPGTELINGYGPTESTTFTCCQAIERELSPAARSIPIGQPISNTQVYLLDAHLQPVPLGVAGELYIGGDGLARGYLKRPELTAERFVPHPSSSRPGTRLYKTGDLARYLPDGRIEFLGRLDHQVKVRGYRIELGEIEQALLQHPAVSECVVIARDDPASSKQLVAYVVAAPDREAVEEAGLRSFLGERLPEYMLPSHIMVLDALPLSANGKVDRQALLAHRPEESEQQPHEREQPRDQIELQLLHIWERVLERGPISLTDNFFSLGGHSLATLRLHAQIENEFHRQLPLGLLFQYPTIRELARILRQEIGYVRGSALVPLQPHGSRAPFFCVHPAGGSVFCYLDLVRHLGMNYPVYGLQVPEVEGEQAIASVEQLAAHYIAVVQTVQPEGPYLLGGWSAGGSIAYEMACQLRYQGHEVALLCLFDSFRFVSSGQPRQEYIQGSTLKDSLVALLNVDEQEISRLTEEEQLRAAYDALRRELILPDGLDLAYVQRFIHLQAAIIKAVRAYEPPCSDQSITLIRVEQEGESVAETVKDGREPVHDSTNGWRAVTTAHVDVHTVPGTHNEMFSEPYVQTVASTLQACLDKQGKEQESTVL